MAANICLDFNYRLRVLLSKSEGLFEGRLEILLLALLPRLNLTILREI